MKIAFAASTPVNRPNAHTIIRSSKEGQEQPKATQLQNVLAMAATGTVLRSTNCKH